MKHPLPNSFVTRPVRIALVGCGGNGTQMLTGLARMHIALRAFGHPGFEVCAYDPDRVSEANIGRQLFSPADVGHHKAVLLVHRLNVFFGLDWQAIPEIFPSPDDEQAESYMNNYQAPGIVIGCVDTRASRRAIAKWGNRFAWQAGQHRDNDHYWLDVGNLSNTGQVVLGQFTPKPPTRKKLNSRPKTLMETMGGRKISEEDALAAWRRELLPLHLPNIGDLFPGILDDTQPEEDLPSCSLAEALESQDLFVNQAVTTFALQLLWMWFRQGGLTHHGYFVNLATGSVSRLPIDKAAWARFNPALCGIKPLDSGITKIKKNASRVKRKTKPKPKTKTTR